MVKCWNCYASGAKHLCGNCKIAAYCSASCQKTDWKGIARGHKKDCADWQNCSKETLYEVTLAPANHPDSIARGDIIIEKLSCRRGDTPAPRVHSKNVVLAMIRDDAALEKAIVSRDFRWIVELLDDDISGPPPKHPYPDGYCLINQFLGCSNNQVHNFRVKNFLLTEGMFPALMRYAFHYTMVHANSTTSTVLWRFINCFFVHPVNANIGLSMLHEDQTRNKCSITALLTTMMQTDAIPDNVQGLIYQMVALIELQSDGDFGIDKSAASRLVPQCEMYQTLYQMAKTMVPQYITIQNTRL